MRIFFCIPHRPKACPKGQRRGGIWFHAPHFLQTKAPFGGEFSLPKGAFVCIILFSDKNALRCAANLEIVLAVFLHHADRLCADAPFFALKAELFRRRCLDVHARKGQFERIRHILPHLRNVGE